MYQEIIEKIEKIVSSSEFDKIKNKQLHLGIFSEPYLTYMLDGKKTIESRFSKNRCAPFNKISKDDIVIIKKSSGKIVGYFTIKDVLFFDLSSTDIKFIRKKYSKELCVDDIFWDNKKNSNYATLIIIDKIVKVTPFPINKKGMQTWIVL